MSERYEPSGPPDSTMVALLQSENEALRQIIREALPLMGDATPGGPIAALLERMRAAAGDGKEQR